MESCDCLSLHVYIDRSLTEYYMWPGHPSLKKLKQVGVFPKVTSGATSEISKQAMQAVGLFAKCCDIDALIKNARTSSGLVHFSICSVITSVCAVITLQQGPCGHSCGTLHIREKSVFYKSFIRALRRSLFELCGSQTYVLLLERQLGFELNTRQSPSENVARVHQTSLSSRGLLVASKLGSILDPTLHPRQAA